MKVFNYSVKRVDLKDKTLQHAYDCLLQLQKLMDRSAKYWFSRKHCKTTRRLITIMGKIQRSMTIILTSKRLPNIPLGENNVLSVLKTPKSYNGPIDWTTLQIEAKRILDEVPLVKDMNEYHRQVLVYIKKDLLDSAKYVLGSGYDMYHRDIIPKIGKEHIFALLKDVHDQLPDGVICILHFRDGGVGIATYNLANLREHFEARLVESDSRTRKGCIYRINSSGEFCRYNNYREFFASL